MHLLPTATDTRIKPTLGHQPSPSPSTKVKNGSICPSNCPVPQFSSRRPLDLSAVAAGFPSSSRRLASCRVLSTHAVHNPSPPAIAYTYIQRAAAGKENLPIKTPRAPGGGVRDPRGPASSSRPRSSTVARAAPAPNADISYLAVWPQTRGGRPKTRHHLIARPSASCVLRIDGGMPAAASLSVPSTRHRLPARRPPDLTPGAPWPCGVPP